MEKKNIIIVILAILVVWLSGYIVYDKVFSDNDKDDNIVENNDEDINNVIENTDNDEDNQLIKTENAEFFDEYLKIFLPGGSANNFKKTIEEFSDNDITLYLLFYYMSLGGSEKIETTQIDGVISYTANKEEFDEVVEKYFGIKEYNIIDSTGRDGIKKLDSGEYQVFWFATGWMAPEATNIGVKYDGNEVLVEYKLTNDTYGSYGEESKLTFKLIYNDGNYNVNSIIYSEL